MNGRNFTKARFIHVNQLPHNNSHLTAKYYVHELISLSVLEPSLLRLDPDEKVELDEQISMVLNSTLT